MVNDYTRDEMMTVATSRFIRDGCSAFIGTGLPMVAAFILISPHDKILDDFLLIPAQLFIL